MILSRSTLRLFRYFPLPEWDEQPLSWVIDTTGPELTRRTWATDQCPYEYTDRGRWVRMAMGRDRRRTVRVHRNLSDYVRRTSGELHDLAGLPRTVAVEDVANVLLVQAIMIERSTRLVLVTVYWGGSAFFHSAATEPMLQFTPHVDVLPAGWTA